MRNQAKVISLSENQKRIPEQLQTGTHSPLHLKQRSKIILESSCGHSNNDIERNLRICGEAITKWRNRYAAAAPELSRTESEAPGKLRSIIVQILSDAPRSGKPSTFTDEQVACIVAMSCQKPNETGLPFSHWTPSLLAEEAIRRGIVRSISAMQVSRFLKRERFKTASD